MESVLAQSYGNFELIVVDDGSTDETAECAELIRPGHPLPAPGKPGVSSARNLGLSHARAELIALLDSDDLWQPGKLEAQVRFFNSNPQALICQTDETWIRNGRRVNPKKYHKKQSGDIFGVSLERCMVSPSAVMFRAALLDEVGHFDPALPACEDYDLWLRVSCRHPVHLLPEPLTIKRGGHPDQLSTSVAALDRYRIEAICKLLDDDVLTPVQREQALAMLAQKTDIYCQGCRKRNKIEEVERIRSHWPAISDSTNPPGKRITSGEFQRSRV